MHYHISTTNPAAHLSGLWAAVAPNFCTAADLSTLGQFAAASDDQKVSQQPMPLRLSHHQWDNTCTRQPWLRSVAAAVLHCDAPHRRRRDRCCAALQLLHRSATESTTRCNAVCGGPGLRSIGCGCGAGGDGGVVVAGLHRVPLGAEHERRQMHGRANAAAGAFGRPTVPAAML